MWNFILEYWIEILFGALVTMWGVLCKKIKQKQIKQDALTKGMLAILHDMLFQLCEKYLALGYIPVDEAEEIIKRENKIFEAYDGLHGNHTGTEVHKKFIALPIKKRKE